MSVYFPSPLPFGSWDAELLAPITELNEQTLELLTSMAERGSQRAADDGSDGRGALQPGVTPRLVQLLRADWLRLDARAQRRLSACPYVLLDAQLSQLARWQRLLSGGVMDAPAHASAYFSGRAGVALIRQMLLLAWHLARSNRLMAGVTLGLSAPVAERIAATRLKDLDAIAELCPGWIMPRWEQQPNVWRQLMNAARSEHPLSLRHAQLRGLQLLARPHTRP